MPLAKVQRRFCVPRTMVEPRRFECLPPVWKAGGLPTELRPPDTSAVAWATLPMIAAPKGFCATVSPDKI